LLLKIKLKLLKSLLERIKMSSIKNTGERKNQLTNATNYDVKRIVFSEPQAGSVPNTPIQFRRINIATLNKDGSIGDLILPTERVFSFGTSENKNPETQKVNGHVLPLCLWGRNGATEAEKAWTDTFDKIIEHCKKYLIDNKEELGLYELEPTDLKKFNPLYWKRDKGKIVEGTGPTLYAKLIASKKHDKIMSMFFNIDGDSIDPLSLIGKYCYVKGAIKFESIFIGNKISLQVKLYEAEVETMDTGMKPLMSRRPKASNSLLSGAGNNMNEFGGDEDEVEFKPSQSAPSIPNSDVEDDEDEPVKPATPAPPKAVKRVVKKAK
jgi:hypothetical protein